LYSDGESVSGGVGPTLKVRHRYVTTWQCGTTGRTFVNRHVTTMVLNLTGVYGGTLSGHEQACIEIQCAEIFSSYDFISALVPWLHMPS
jgi:hypothetical protein